MLTRFRKIVGRAEESLAFVRNNPFEGPGPDTIVQRLGTLIERTKELVRGQQEREQARARAVMRKETIRKHLGTGLLRLFAGAGQEAARSHPALAEEFRVIRVSGPSLGFLTRAESLVAATQANLEVVQPFGVEPGMIDEATALLAEFETSAHQASEAKAARIQARAELFPVAAEMMNLLRRLDGLNRHRYARDSARLASWMSAFRSPGPLKPRDRSEPAVMTPDPLPGMGADGKAA
ncbi:MAG: hypothetical protein ACYC2K_14600 [Gemmatimonadales bacterium]